MAAPGPVVRIVTDVAALDKEFDYLVPDGLSGSVQVGTMVRLALGGRRVGGWVVATDVEPDPAVRLRPLARRRGWGPEAAVVDLAGWAAWRWAGARSALLTTASPHLAVVHLPEPSPTPPPPPASATPGSKAIADMVADALAGESGLAAPYVIRLPPGTDPTAVIAGAAQRGPTLVIVPTVAGAAVVAARLRRAGAGVALVPEEWALARAGAAVVVGARAAAWAPCPGLAAVVVIDGHDEALHQEQNPTWDATSVVAERARRAAVPCLVTSPCPTLDLLAAAARVVLAPRALERAGWAAIEVVDRRADDPRLGLYSEALVALVRHGGRVACVLNRKGRARLLACRSCAALARCERCASALAEAEPPAEGDGMRALACPRCGWQRPWLCVICGSMALRQLRLGVSRVRDDLERLAGRPVAEVTGGRREPEPEALRQAPVVVGTEAVLYRGGRFDEVAFLDFDGEVLAPRFRAGEEALGLLARAARLVGGRGRVLIQTRIPDHPVITAAAAPDPAAVADAERQLRVELRWPPFAALAAVSGAGAAPVVAALGNNPAIEILGPDRGRWLVRAANATTLADALATRLRPAARVRIEVDPLRM